MQWSADPNTGAQSTKNGNLKAMKSKHCRLVTSDGVSGLVSLQGVGPSWPQSRMMEYHIKYAHAFVFLFDVCSREAFEGVKEMHDALLHSARALGATTETGVPLSVLVGNIENDIDVAKRKHSRHREVPPDDARVLADKWSCEYMEIDTSDGDAAFDLLVHISVQTIKKSLRDHEPGVLAIHHPVPPRKLRLRRYLDSLGLGAFVKSHTK